MGSHVYWLFFFVLLYWGYCITIGVTGYLKAKKGTDYFIAGRQLNIWVFVLAATATSFSGWTFVGHPALMWRDGLPYGYASFYVLTIPITGVFFLKRQWLLGKRYGFVTPGEMYSQYMGGEAIRILTVIVALFFSIPYLGIQLRASGILFNVLTDGLFSVNVGMWMLAIIVCLYVALGGLRSVAYVDTAQCILLWSGIVALGFIAASFAGGFDGLTSKFGDVVVWFNSGGAEVPKWADPEAVKVFLEKGKGLIGITPLGVTNKVAVPGVIQFVPAGAMAKGGTWTGIMILTYMFALMGIHSSPAFSMWAFANKNPKPFPLQQVWASTAGIGFALIIFTTMQAMGGWVLAFLPSSHGAGTVLPLEKLISSWGQRSGALSDSPDERHGALCRRHSGHLRPGGHAVHRRGLHVDGQRYADPRHCQAVLQKRHDRNRTDPLGSHHRGRGGRVGFDLRHLCAGRDRDARCICDVFRIYDVCAPDRHTLLAMADAPGGCRRPDLRHVRSVPDLQVRSRTSLGLQSTDDFFRGLGNPVQPTGRHPGEFLHPAG